MLLGDRVVIAVGLNFLLSLSRKLNDSCWGGNTILICFDEATDMIRSSAL